MQAHRPLCKGTQERRVCYAVDMGVVQVWMMRRISAQGMTASPGHGASAIQRAPHGGGTPAPSFMMCIWSRSTPVYHPLLHTCHLPWTSDASSPSSASSLEQPRPACPLRPIWGFGCQSQSEIALGMDDKTSSSLKPSFKADPPGLLVITFLWIAYLFLSGRQGALGELVPLPR